MEQAFSSMQSNSNRVVIDVIFTLQVVAESKALIQF
jgi:hypothetical protein